jgi:RimJ/RimL family protein N-acetyltransferase
MKSHPEIETKRLLLRGFVASDASVVQRLAGDRSIADTTLAIPHPYEDGLAEEWIATHEEEFARGRGLTLAIVIKGDTEPIGAISLMTVSRGHSRAELGYWVGQAHWNHGYCTEAAEAVLSYAFEVLKLNRVYAVHLARNTSSGRVMQKLGMKHEGRQRQHVRKWDVLEDIELYGVLAEEWTHRARGS